MTAVERTDEPLLAIRDLTVEFGGGGRGRATPVVRGVDVTVWPGEAVGIAGESGSGKSLTAMSIMGLLPGAARASGSITLAGRELLGLTEKEYRSVRGSQVGMIFQDSAAALHPMLSIGTQLTEHARGSGRRARRAARGRAIELLERVRMPRPDKVVDAFPHQLSGGMRQRVAIAIALARDPALLIADEPTTALDVTVQAGILQLLDQLRRDQGLAVLFITHDLGVLSALTSRVHVFYAGEVMESGPTAQLMAEPRHPYTGALLHARPQGLRHRGLLQPIPGSPAAAGDVLQGCPFAPRCAYVEDRCRAQDAPLTEVAPGQRSACHVLPRLEGAFHV